MSIIDPFVPNTPSGSGSTGKSGASKSSGSIKSTADAALKPGWVILVLGGSGYLLSETRVIGPILSILLATAAIYQLTQYIGSRSKTT